MHGQTFPVGETSGKGKIKEARLPRSRAFLFLPTDCGYGVQY
jgi:hypothetical protein